MVTLTESAIDVIRRLTSRPEVSAGGGLRFANGSTRGSLAVDVADEPHEGDEVVDTDGVRLFLDGMAARAFDGKVLDATVVNGSVRFNVSDNAGRPDIP